MDATHIGDAGRLRTELLPSTRYYDLLASRAAEVDVWHTVYQHPMATAAAIVEWLSGTGLKPFVDPLPAELQHALLGRVRAPYRPGLSGACRWARLLAFPRMFIVARKS